MTADDTVSAKVTVSNNSYHFKTSEPIYVLGDIQGAYDEVINVLVDLQLLNTKGQWTGGNTHVVSLGDFVSQDSSTIKVLELFKQLQENAESAGGQFHLLLGDKELQHITNHLEGGDRQLTSDQVQWLMNLPFVIQINDQVFAHGGLSKDLAKQTLSELNQTLTDGFIQPYEKDSSIVTQNQSTKASSMSKNPVSELLFSHDNPALYQGNKICHPYFEADNLANILHNWSASRLWVAHSTSRKHQLISRFNQMLMMIDSSMKHTEDETSWVVRIDQNKEAPMMINVVTGEMKQAQLAAKRQLDNPYSMTEFEIEEFLKTAEIIHRKELSIGVTKPIKMTLQKDEKQLKAIFKYVDSKPGKERKKWRKDVYVDDRYSYDIAAYKLDRMLDIGLVPVVVERTIDGKKGILQLWIDDLISKKSQKEKKLDYSGHCNYKDQINMIDTFDYLIRNIDRNQSNILYSKSDWQIWFIDHSRSFDLSMKRPKMMKKHTIRVTKSFLNVLEALSKEKLNTLRPWLHRKQIRAINDRRRRILKNKI